LTLTEKEGSGPREPGSKMLVTSKGRSLGTIGGGGMERILVDAAMKALEEGKPRILEFAMGIPAREGMITVDSKCGGEVRIFMDVIDPSPRLIVMGSGLIAQSVAQYANDCGFEITVVDDADTARPEIFPFAKLINDPYPESLEKLEIKASDYVLMLHGETDFELHGLRYAVDSDPQFIGLLGSKNKAREHKKQLIEEGYPTEIVEKILGHVGLDIGAETPEEIGISIVAQLIDFRYS
jgi:xanthine dehydrogenase accessory factor